MKNKDKICSCCGHKFLWSDYYPAAAEQESTQEYCKECRIKINQLLNTRTKAAQNLAMGKPLTILQSLAMYGPDYVKKDPVVKLVLNQASQSSTPQPSTTNKADSGLVDIKEYIKSAPNRRRVLTRCEDEEMLEELQIRGWKGKLTIQITDTYEL